MKPRMGGRGAIMVNPNRREWLNKKIGGLTDRALFEELSEIDRIFLDSYKEEFRQIESKEAQEKEQTKQDKSREMKQRRGRGKYGEQRLAKKVGGKVVGRSKWIFFDTDYGQHVIQINCQKPPDVVTMMFSFESKWLKQVPANIRKVMTQAISNSPQGLIPIGVIGDREQREVYYILMEHDWLSLHGK